MKSYWIIGALSLLFCFSCSPSEEQLWMQAKTALDKGDKTQAMTHLDELLKVNENHSQGLNARGVVKYQLLRYEEALKDFEKAARLDEQDYKPLFNKANVLRDQEKYAEAITYYTKAIDLRPNVMDIYNNRGYTFFRLGQLHQAEQDFQVALKLDPANEVIKANLEKIAKIHKH